MTEAIKLAKIKEPVRELLCQVCDKEYQRWYAENSIWNLLIQHDSRDIHFLCPTCFTNLIQKILKKKVKWKLYIPYE